MNRSPRRIALLLGLLSVCVPPSPAWSQVTIEQRPLPPVLGVVDTIILSGNRKTQDYVILNEMSLHAGDTATAAGIAYDRSRIYGLGLFTRVDIAYDSLPGLRFLFVDVSERWYIIPYPIFGFRDGDPHRPYGGGGILHNNLGGANQKLSASLVLGNDPSASLAFRDPLLIRNGSVFFSGGAYFSRVRNKSEEQELLGGRYDDLTYGADVSFGRRMTLSQSLGLSFGAQAVEVSRWYPGRTLSPDGRDRFLDAGASYNYDSRDLYEYATRGQLLSFSLFRFGLGEGTVSYSRFSVDARQYTPLPFDITLAARAHGSLVAGGDVPTYGHTYFGYGERLRGWFTTVFEGEDLAGGAIELRRFLIPPLIIRMSSLPIPEQFSIWRFALALAVGVNTGTTWYRGDRLEWNSGCGGGLHFLLPYGVIIRTEVAWNQHGHREFILDFRGSI